MPQFETFRKSSVPRVQQPQLTIRKHGAITWNAAAHAALGSPTAVELLYDRVQQLLGIRAVSTAEPHACFVRPANRAGHGPYLVSAMAFLRYFDIDTELSRRWRARLDESILCADLAGPAQIVSKASPELA